MLGQSNPFSETQHTKNGMQRWRRSSRRRRRSPSQSWVCTSAASVALFRLPSDVPLHKFSYVLIRFWSRLFDKIKIKKKEKKTNDRKHKGWNEVIIPDSIEETNIWEARGFTLCGNPEKYERRVLRGGVRMCWRSLAFAVSSAWLQYWSPSSPRGP